MEIKVYLTVEVDDDWNHVEDGDALTECIEQSIQHFGTLTDSEVK